ncbi:MAG: helix-turn-helix transcriptional regulator [Burkholderiaceae bacterium]
MLKSDQYDEAIRLLYLAGSGLTPWEEALGSIAGSMALWGAHLASVNKHSGAINFVRAGGEMPPEATLDYIGKYHQCNPRVKPLMSLEGQSWMHCHEHFDDAFVAHDRFYQEFLIPYGGRYLSATKISHDEQETVFFACLRGPRDKPLNEDEIQALERLRLHIAAALTIFSQLRAQRVETTVGSYMLRRLKQAVLLVDDERRVRYINNAAESFISQSQSLQVQARQLVCTDASEDEQLSASVRTLLESDTQLGQGHRHVLRLSKNPHEPPTLLMLVRMQPDESMKAFGNSPAALVMCHQVSTNQSIDPTIVANAYGLSPAEAQVAIALAGGLTAAQVAERRHVAQSTVKTQIKQAYAKMGISNQVDLVRHLLELPEILATDLSIEMN